jgi:hypothetical protein
MLDFSLALVACRLENLLVIVGCEMRRQQRDRCQRHVTGLEAFEKNWIRARCASSLDSAVSRVLGQVQHLGAVGEQRGIPFSEIQASCIELGEGGDEVSRRTALSSREMVNCRDEITIGKLTVCENVRRHFRCIPRDCSRL